MNFEKLKKFLLLVRLLNIAEEIIKLLYVQKYLFIVFKYRWSD